MVGGPKSVEISTFIGRSKMEENGRAKTLKIEPFCGTVFEAAPSLIERPEEL